MAGFFAFVALYSRELGLDGSRNVLLLFGLIVMGTRITFARLPDRVPPFRLAAIALALSALGLGVVGILATVEGLFIGAAILAVGVAFTTPAFFAAIFSRVPASERGSASGTASLFLDLAFGGGPMLLGLIAGQTSIPAALTVAAVVTAIGAVGTASQALPGRRANAAA